MDQAGVSKPWGWPKSSEEVLQQCLSVVLRAKPAGLELGPQVAEGVGGLVGGSIGPVHHLLGSAGRWMLGERRHVYATDLLPVVSTPLKWLGDPSLHPGAVALKGYNESIKNCILENLWMSCNR